MMVYELSQRFQFEAAHTLERDIDAESSRRIHGHTYHAEVTLRGMPDPATGMLMDLGHFRRAIAQVQDLLDHRLLNEVDGLAKPTPYARLHDVGEAAAAEPAAVVGGEAVARVGRRVQAHRRVTSSPEESALTTAPGGSR